MSYLKEVFSIDYLEGVLSVVEGDIGKPLYNAVLNLQSYAMEFFLKYYLQYDLG